MKTIQTVCPICGEVDTITLTDEECANLLRWEAKELLIQEALPNRTADEREQIKTGICASCWTKLFR